MAGLIKTGDHHWWPQCVARLWMDEAGIVRQLFPDGKVIEQKNTKKFGHIKNAHLIKLHKDPETPTVWDESFESRFDKIDSQFPKIISWLEGLPFEDTTDGRPRQQRFLRSPQDWGQLNLLIQAILSLVVRGPRLRRIVQSTTEYFRERMGIEDPSASKSLINLNLRHALDMFVQAGMNRGKFAVLHSPVREFIFGDGFLHSYASTANAPMTAQVLVPLTPNLAVLWIVPSQYTPNPNLSTIVLRPEEADIINETVLVHSQEFVFYRSQKPPLIEAFVRKQHLIYEYPGHPAVQAMIQELARLR